MTHRKVISYYTFADEIDEDGGHGTHVVGSIVANDPMSSGGNSRGAAPGAKVAFIDIGSPTGAVTRMALLFHLFCMHCCVYISQ